MGERKTTNPRIEKASSLLTFWAYRIYKGSPVIEQSTHFHTGSSQITDMNSYKSYKPFCFKMKTNAKQDRPKGKSTPPLGGASTTETNERRAQAIDKLLSEKLTPKQREIVFFLFLPRTLISKTKLSDKVIAVARGYNPKRACELKYRAIDLVNKEILSPFTE